MLVETADSILESEPCSRRLFYELRLVDENASVELREPIEIETNDFTVRIDAQPTGCSTTEVAVTFGQVLALGGEAIEVVERYLAAWALAEHFRSGFPRVHFRLLPS